MSRTPASRERSPMKLVIPSNFQPDLVERVKGPRAHSIYARLPVDFVGGGRSPVLLPSVSRKRAEAHIAECHRAGLRFNYVLNSPSLNNQEFSRAGQRKLRSLLEWIDQAGADEVTVTIPYLLELVKRHHPRLEVSVSTFAGVANPQRARRWQDLGADCITLSVTGVGRSFKTMAAIRRAVDIELQVIGNLLCVHQCPYDHYHGIIEGHASQEGHPLHGFVLDYCRLHCLNDALRTPANFLRAAWIRPEDQGAYEDLGIDRLKLVNRIMVTPQIGQIVDAYRQRRFDGNLFELLGFPANRTVGAWGYQALWRQVRYYLRPRLVNVVKLRRSASKIAKTDGFYLDNRKLDGFLDYFVRNDCFERSCADCKYCDHAAEKALRVEEKARGRMARQTGETLDGLVSGDVFRWDVKGSLDALIGAEPSDADALDETSGTSTTDE